MRLLDHRPSYAGRIANLPLEWKLVDDRSDCQALFVDCSNVQILRSEMLSTLILLQRRLKENARLVLSGLRAGVREVLSWTRIDRFFEIEVDEEQEVTARA